MLHSKKSEVKIEPSAAHLDRLARSTNLSKSPFGSASSPAVYRRRSCPRPFGLVWSLPYESTLATATTALKCRRLARHAEPAASPGVDWHRWARRIRVIKSLRRRTSSSDRNCELTLGAALARRGRLAASRIA